MKKTVFLVMLNHLLVPFRAAFSVAAFLTLTACSCDDETQPKPAETESLAPLAPLGVPSSVKAEVYPLVGTTVRRPVVMTLAEEPCFCEQTKSSLGKVAHVICSSPSPDGAAQPESEARLRAALVFLKKSYPRYLSKSPVIFVSGPAYQETAWKMLLAEPGFFAHSYISGPNQPELTNTLMAALHGKGAKTLVFDAKLAASDRLISQAAGRAGLRIESVGTGASSLGTALKILSQADKRLAASPAVQASSPSP